MARYNWDEEPERSIESDIASKTDLLVWIINGAALFGVVAGIALLFWMCGQ